VDDHTQADADHTIASADHNLAGQDHTRAESDHTRAESDHAAVEVYVDSLGVFDLSKHNAVGGVMATYADLSAALTALNSLESKYKYGGMSFKFVQSSDNKYVQARCMAQNFTTDVTQWQGVNEEPIPDSKSLVESGGVYKFLAKDIIAKVTSPSYTNGIVYTNGTINSSVSGYGYTNAIELKSGETLHLNNDNSIYHGGDVALLYKCDANGDWIETLITGGTSYVTKKETYTNKTGSTIYVAICAYTNSLGYYIDTISKATSESNKQHAKESL
jgi:acyl-coenzyme A thioesterase PaaI-like protein